MCQYMCPIDRPSFLSPVGSADQAVPRRTRPSVEAPFTGTDELQRLVGMAQAELRKRGPPTTTMGVFDGCSERGEEADLIDLDRLMM